ncbi:hypothetical protein [Clostridium senegalense]|uniref:hypothetical protein n=1 Tax=Clostridium senegalense TaxID=1465809 RepID=UPI00028A28F0|nr:hypothetical protein [Clostridium senegalense]MBU5225952.1 asparagine synthase [Clostridium senegalense]
MRKGVLPVALGTVVTATGVILDTKQSKRHKFRKNDYKNMAGALLVGAGIAHIVLGGIDISRD